MENNIPIPETPQPIRGVRWKQTTAGVLFVLTYVLLILASLVPQLFMIPIGNSEYGEVTRMGITMFTFPLFMLCAFLLLRPLSANRVVRLVTLVLTIAFGVTLAVRVFGFLVFSPDSVDSLFSRRVLSDYIEIALTIASIFSFSCILKNYSQLLESARVWVQLILCVLGVEISFIVCTFLLRFVLGGELGYEFFYGSLFYQLFCILTTILLAIAYYKFAKSDLFCGVFDDSPVPAGAYSIVNKYWAAVLVVIVLFSIAMFFIELNANELYELLN